MSNELHQHPETRVEHKDMLGITDPRTQKNLATNQGVRFYVEKQLGSQEDAIMRAMQDGFAAQSVAFQELTDTLEWTTAALRDLQARLNFIEERWYERIMQYLEWDILAIREWLWRHFRIGSPKSLDLDLEDQEWRDNIRSQDDMIKTIEDMQIPGPENGTMDQPEPGMCICGHTAIVHSFEGNGPCTIEGCNCDVHELVTVELVTV
jgi:hypothetical protein